MIFDDETPAPHPTRLPHLALDRLSVSDLDDYIDELRAEIARVEADRTKKSLSRNAAEAFFRRLPSGQD